MRDLPSGLVAYQRTKEFTEETVPAGLLRRHTTKSGVWGRIVVVEGSLRYRILESENEEIILTAPREDEARTSAQVGIVEPNIPHEVEPIGAVRFYVEFLRHEQPVAPK